MFNLYQGVRAGGGIGDVIEPADGDDSEVYRILFDISFFFFIIVILLAIIQGMYIRWFRIFQTSRYQGIVKATVLRVFEDLKFKISEGSDQNWCCPDSVLLAVSV